MNLFQVMKRWRLRHPRILRLLQRIQAIFSNSEHVLEINVVTIFTHNKNTPYKDKQNTDIKILPFSPKIYQYNFFLKWISTLKT